MLQENNNPPLLLCLSCHKEIPGMTLNIHSSQLTSKCLCTKQSTTLSLQDFLTQVNANPQQEEGSCEQHGKSSTTFCPECNAWLCANCIKFHSKYSPNHITSPLPIPIKCHKHSKDYQLYCNDCCYNLCPEAECKAFHSKHFFYRIDKEINGEYSEVTLTNIMSKKKTKTVLLGEMIESEVLILMQKIERLRQIKKEIEEEMKVNEERDWELRRFYQSLVFTKAVFNKRPTYQISTLVNGMKINERLVNIDGDEDVEAKAVRMLKYLKSNYIFKQGDEEDEMERFDDVPLKSKKNDRGGQRKKRDENDNDDDNADDEGDKKKIYLHSESNEKKRRDGADYNPNDYLLEGSLRDIMKKLQNKGSDKKKKPMENLRDIDLS